jgi:hypothetical protein
LTLSASALILRGIVNDRKTSVADGPSVPPTKPEPLNIRSAPYVYKSKGYRAPKS